VRRILKGLSRQQVYGFLANPSGGDPIWYLDAPEDVQENRYPLNTCLLRGWIEELDTGSQSYKGFPIAQPLIPKGGSFDDFPKPPYYRLTSAGWNALYRSYELSRIAFAVSLVALVISLTNALRKPEAPTLKVAFPAPTAPNVLKKKIRAVTSSAAYAALPARRSPARRRLLAREV
jgi:hypothetical protein